MKRLLAVAFAALVALGLSAPSTAAQTAPAAYVAGAEAWTGSDCGGDVPIVVGSDAKAQSDIYSAVTLAGVLGTDCVILAGARGASMPASQRTRLEAAAAGGFVLGGTAAVPTAKTFGRDMTRLGGETRWDTAQLVGRRASGDTGTGTPTREETTTDTGTPNTAGFTAISAGGFHSCGLRSDGTAVCWGRNHDGQADAPEGAFTAMSAGGTHSCGLRTNGTATGSGGRSSRRASTPI